MLARNSHVITTLWAGERAAAARPDGRSLRAARPRRSIAADPAFGVVLDHSAVDHFVLEQVEAVASAVDDRARREPGRVLHQHLVAGLIDLGGLAAQIAQRAVAGHDHGDAVV